MNPPRYLLDVNVIVALLWTEHVSHRKAGAWFSREQPIVLTCALTELGFLRVSMADRTLAASHELADSMLSHFDAILGERYVFIPSESPFDLLKGVSAPSHGALSDLYLCELAEKNGARLATLDTGIRHRAALQIA